MSFRKVLRWRTFSLKKLRFRQRSCGQKQCEDRKEGRAKYTRGAKHEWHATFREPRKSETLISLVPARRGSSESLAGARVNFARPLIFRPYFRDYSQSSLVWTQEFSSRTSIIGKNCSTSRQESRDFNQLGGLWLTNTTPEGALRAIFDLMVTHPEINLGQQGLTSVDRRLLSLAEAVLLNS